MYGIKRCLLQFQVPEVLQREDVLKGHRAEAFCHARNMMAVLCTLQAILRTFEKFVSTFVC